MHKGNTIDALQSTRTTTDQPDQAIHCCCCLAAVTLISIEQLIWVFLNVHCGGPTFVCQPFDSVLWSCVPEAAVQPRQCYSENQSQLTVVPGDCVADRNMTTLPIPHPLTFYLSLSLPNSNPFPHSMNIIVLLVAVAGWLAAQATRRDLCPLSANQSICLKFYGISHSMPPTTSFASLLAMTEAFGVDPPACLPACCVVLLLLRLWPPTIRDNFRPINVESTQSKTRITRLIDYIWEYPQIRSLIRQLICGWWAS